MSETTDHVVLKETTPVAPPFFKCTSCLTMRPESEVYRCKTCDEARDVITTICHVCQSSGRYHVDHEVELKVPRVPASQLHPFATSFTSVTSMGDHYDEDGQASHRIFNRRQFEHLDPDAQQFAITNIILKSRDSHRAGQYCPSINQSVPFLGKVLFSWTLFFIQFLFLFF